MLQSCYLSRYMPGLVQSVADYQFRWSVVLQIERHWDCKCPVLLWKSSIFQQALNMLHVRVVRHFEISISLNSEGRSGFHLYAFWFRVFCEFLEGILTVFICPKSLHIIARLILSRSPPFFQFLQFFWLVLQYLVICMPHGIAYEEHHISTSSDGCFQGTAYVRVHKQHRLSGTGGCGSKGLSG